MSFIVKGLHKPRACREWREGKMRECVMLDGDDCCKAIKGSSRMDLQEQYAVCPIVAIPWDHEAVILQNNGKVLLEAEHEWVTKKPQYNGHPH